jgi:hypothetical protein
MVGLRIISSIFGLQICAGSAGSSVRPLGAAGFGLATAAADVPDLRPNKEFKKSLSDISVILPAIRSRIQPLESATCVLAGRSPGYCVSAAK